MDVWVFAAAAGAGYMAQQLKNLSVINRNWPNFSYDVLKCGASIHKALDEGGPLRKQVFGINEVDSDDDCVEEIASSSGLEGRYRSTSNVVCDSESSCGLEEDIVEDSDHEADELKASGSSCCPSIIEIGFSFGSKQVKASLKCRGGLSHEFVKPLTALECCLLAHLWNGESRMEEYISSANASWRAILHPLPVAGCGPISGPLVEWCCQTKEAGNNNLGSKKFLVSAKRALVIPTLPNIGSKKSPVKATKKPKQVLARRNVEKSVSGDLEIAKGSSNDLVLFYLGLMIGVLCTSSANHLEVEKLKKSLKQTENLVQDLQDELQMKDSLTVRELTTENNELLDSSNVCFDDTTQCADEESFRKIEAELEAELDRLQLNVSFQLERNLPVAELSPDFEPDFAEGELTAECFSRRADSQYHSERRRSSVPTPCSSQYPVSPRLLSLKLHEVIQSRLTERIKQLETALESVTKFPESESMLSSTKEPDYEAGSCSSSSEELQPVVIHLPGESRTSYNEAYEELLTTFSESDKEEINNHDVGSAKHDEDPEQDVVMTDDCRSWNESETGDDEMERLLIQQIVEKARRGSPAVMKAKWALLSTNEDDAFYHQEPDIH